MEAISNANLFTDLTEDEAAALNGGFRCYVRGGNVCRFVRGFMFCRPGFVRICR